MSPHEHQPRTDGLRGTVLRSARSFYQLLGNRRKYERMPLRDAVVLTLNGGAVVRTESCLSVDISPRGIGLECPGPIELDSIVELRSHEHGTRRLARVCHCRQSGERYLFGLEFLPDPYAAK